MLVTDFYCEDCDLDQRLPGYEQGYLDSFSKKMGWKVTPRWYANDCKKCNRKLIRYITEKHLDPYFRKSKKLRYLRRKYANELIQPNDPKFALLYPEKAREMSLAKDRLEKRKESYAQERDVYYRKFRHNINERQVVKKVLEKEEELENKSYVGN